MYIKELVIVWVGINAFRTDETFHTYFRVLFSC